MHVEAFIKVDAGDEEISLNVNNVLSSKRFTRDAYIELYSSMKVEVSEIVSSSEFISAREIVPEDSTRRQDSIHIEITFEPGLKPGLLSEKIVIHFKDDARPRANVYLYGIVVDEIEVTPLRLVYVVSDTVLDTKNQTRRLTVTNHRDDLPLEIIDASVPGDFLEVDVKTLIEGRTYELTAVGTEKILVVDSVLTNDIVITTNNPDKRRVKVPFQVLRK